MPANTTATQHLVLFLARRTLLVITFGTFVFACDRVDDKVSCLGTERATDPFLVVGVVWRESLIIRANWRVFPRCHLGKVIKFVFRDSETFCVAY
ncbi:hypothetical protein F4810DRAFT_676805 [Camillea tinctor]|nr:hypothetical protein F4810DRAFT_676805 [Camillea tinctor]